MTVPPQQSASAPGSAAGRPEGPPRLPVPHTTRWQPLRTGLVDLFYYDYQEFWFRDGRLLLRGNNGTGKSKVLALTLPFLLDGDLSAHRVEPDGDPHKRMEWNLLLDGRHEERLGYTWLEFGRITEDGEHGFLTIGCGLKAAQGRGIADRWFFLTSQRVGDDLFLLSPTGTALARDRLEAAIGLNGQVLRTAEQYRRLIDEHLFHLGQDRYGALIDLLIQLRQPQLSKRPDEARLSRALSDALAPVDQAVLADVAAAFHDLEQQREELTGLRDTRTHVGRFLKRYELYAQIAARRQGRELRTAHSAYEEVGRLLIGVREEIVSARAAHEAGALQAREQQSRATELQAIREQLSDRPELKDLGQAERSAEAAAAAGAGAESRFARAGLLLAQRQQQAEAAAEASGLAQNGHAAATQRALVAAAEAGIEEHQGIAAGLAALIGGIEDSSEPDPPGPPGAALEAAERAGQAAAERRERMLEQVVVLVATADDAGRALTAALHLLAEREADRDTTADELQDRIGELDGAATAHVRDWRGYAAGLHELELADPDELGLGGWTATLDGPNPAMIAVRESLARAQHGLAASIAGLDTRRESAAQERSGLVGEREQLLAGVPRSPVAGHSRDTAGRSERAGAPLWQLVDFRDGVPAADRAAVEAALEAAGLLDAWITPDGSLLDPRIHDAVLRAGTGEAGDGPRLDAVLSASAEPGAAVPAAVVQAILRSVGLHRSTDAAAAGEISSPAEPGAGEPNTPSWVGTDGQFRLGALHGSWAKPDAEYVGHAAREAAKRRRLAELEQLIAAVTLALTTLDDEREALQRRQNRLAEEAAGAPSEQALRDAHAAVATARRDLSRREEALARQQGVAEQARAGLEAAARERDETAADLRLPTAAEKLRAVATAITRYRARTGELFGAARQYLDRLRDVRTWDGEFALAGAAAATAQQEHAEAQDADRAAQARLATLRESIGGTVADLQRRLSETRRQIQELEQDRRRLAGAQEERLRTLGQVEGREQQLAERQAETSGRRDAAVAAFQRFAGTGLLAVADPTLELPDLTGDWAAAPTVQLARRLDQALAQVEDSDQAWRRVTEAVMTRFTELAEALTRHGHTAQSELREDRLVVSIAFQGRDRSPAELTAILDAEVEYRDRMLTAKERELLQEHLVNDVASHLQELISEADGQVIQMNAELQERPTSTGMLLRLRWEPRPDGPDGLPEARSRLLRQDADLWSVQDRTAVSEFLARQIERERAENPYGTWQEHLSKALDYRAWHRFGIERFQDGRWRPGTGPASGGERVLTVSLPLFAAASAHYRSAHPHAPRLVLLDEAFAGVDDDSRAKCLGLLATFDLDVVMTSEREWGFYATVPGIATHQLVRRDGIDAVHVSVWEWDGHTPQLVTREVIARQPAPDGAASAGRRPPPDLGEGLF